MEKEEQLFRKRILDLASTCYQRDIPMHTDFLNLNEQTVFLTMVHSLPDLKINVTGGYEMADRKIVCFVPSYMESSTNIPIKCLMIKPVHEKFAQKLTHRDYLGALMNLGIERSKIGDILIRDDVCHVLCMESMAGFIKNELLFINHTKIECQIIVEYNLAVSQVFDQISGSIASVRLDNVIAMAYQLSRSKAAALIESERVFINSRLMTSTHELLKAGDIISVRKLGKFVFRGVEKQTKKGRLFVTLDKYC